MTTLQNGLLGRLQFDGDGVADTTLPLGERDVDIDVWFDGDPDPDLLDQSSALLADLQSLDAVCRAALAEEQHAFTRYVEHHVASLDPADLCRVCGAADVAAVDGEAFLRALQLVKLDLYPDSEEDLLNCDYSIGEDLTPVVLSVTLDRAGEIAEVAMEN